MQPKLVLTKEAAAEAEAQLRSQAKSDALQMVLAQMAARIYAAGVHVCADQDGEFTSVRTVDPEDAATEALGLFEFVRDALAARLSKPD